MPHDHSSLSYSDNGSLCVCGFLLRNLHGVAFCRIAAGAVTNYDHTHGDPYGLLGLAGAVCNGTEPGVAVMPKAGRAVMFYAKDKAVPNFLLWHAGCHLFAPPLAGGGDGAAAQEGQGKTQGPKERKITIQKFKEAAPIVRYDKSKREPHYSPLLAACLRVPSLLLSFFASLLGPFA